MRGLKRRFLISVLIGITVSKFSDEFVIHCKDLEHDYYYVSTNKRKIIEKLGYAYYEETKNDLKICELETKSLKNIVTLKKEKKKDISFTKMPETNQISLNTYLLGTKSDNPQLQALIKIIS